MATKRALITGITGQDGSYLLELLLSKGYEVHGIIRRASTINTDRIDHIINDSEIFGKTFFLHYGDMVDSNIIGKLIYDLKPNEIYNLAAQSHVKVSFDIPNFTAQVDGLGSLYILEAVKNFSPTTKVYQASTSEMFGGMAYNMPEGGYVETSPFHPRSPYGCAKIYAYWITRNYREAYDIFGCNGLLFNHEGPRRGETFVTRKITLWLAKWVKDPKNTKALQIGNMDAYRDWGHAKDYVRAQWLILQQNKPDDYVIATGETHTVKEFIEKSFKHIGKTIAWEGHKDSEKGIVDGEVVVQVNPKYYRPSEVDYLLGNPTKAKTVLGWQPEFSFDDLVADMVNSDLAKAGI